MSQHVWLEKLVTRWIFDSFFSSLIMFNMQKTSSHTTNCNNLLDQRLHVDDIVWNECTGDSLGICWILWTTTKASDRPTFTGWLTGLIWDTSTGICRINRKGSQETRTTVMWAAWKWSESEILYWSRGKLCSVNIIGDYEPTHVHKNTCVTRLKIEEKSTNFIFMYVFILM